MAGHVDIREKKGVKTFRIRPANKEDKAFIIDLCNQRWAGPVQIARGRAHHVDTHPGFIAVQDNKPVGVITYYIDGDQCEITLLNSLVEGEGIGTALVNEVRNAAREAGCKRFWLITTNDNTTGLRFLQKRGFSLVAVHRNALVKSRELKPEIPLIGHDGIPMRDEIELEIVL
jgi:N-acetylglutamate synthase-like GNAT family acetyltransferase